MISTNPGDRVKRNRLMEQFCAPPRPMLWKDVNCHPNIDAALWREKNSDKLCGLARVVNQQCKFGSKPVVEVEKEVVDFLFELATLTSVHGAIIFKFRDKSMYWRIESPEKLHFENTLSRGKSHTTYHIPIHYLKPV